MDALFAGVRQVHSLSCFAWRALVGAIKYSCDKQRMKKNVFLTNASATLAKGRAIFHFPSSSRSLCKTRPSTLHVWDKNRLCCGVLFSAALWVHLLKGGKHLFIVLDSIKLDFYRAVKLSLYSQINTFAVHPRLSCCCCPSSGRWLLQFPPEAVKPPNVT